MLEGLVGKSEHLERAIDFALEQHSGQFRKSGEPYIVHPLLVAALVTHFGGDEAMVLAAVLHDVIEDCGVAGSVIAEKFGEDVLHLVEGLTKISEIREHELVSSASDQKLLASALSFRKMLMHAVHDPRVLAIKLCDRIHNLLTLEVLSQSKQRRIAEESLVVYAPIAHRLGMGAIKNILEDQSFRYLFPDEYARIDRYFLENSQRINLGFNLFISAVKEQLAKAGIPEESYEIRHRVKHYYSVFMKLQRKGISIEEVLDLLAIRIIVQEPLECYRVLGILHQNFKPIISRFKDYIAIPKDNGYQTLHTTLFYDNSIFEVQIRTREMDLVAEYGIAAHWAYKSGAVPNLEWLNNIEFKNDNIEEFYELAKNDLFLEDIIVYSPKGDLFTLPRGATALDFAYAVHTDIGDRAVAAYVNKQKTSLLHILKNGDICRIETGPTKISRCTWINAVKTSRAKVAMKTLCAQKSRELDRRVAKNILAMAFDFDYQELRDWLDQTNYSASIDKLTTSLDFFKDFLVRVRRESGLRSQSLLTRLRGTPKLREYRIDRFFFYSPKPIHEVTFNLCCHPKPGDEVIAFYNKGKASIHHKFCSRCDELIAQHLPMVFVAWADNKCGHYKLVVSLENKKGSLANFVTALAKEDLFITSLQLRRSETESVAEYCEVEIEVCKDPKKVRENIARRFKVIEFHSTKDAYGEK
ncbi:MAG: RelA/SpoT family protein [Campylobacterales bacterium]